MWLAGQDYRAADATRTARLQTDPPAATAPNGSAPNANPPPQPSKKEHS